MKRQKTRFEKWFSLSRHKRRSGGAQVAAQLAEVDYATLKRTRVSGEQQQFTHGSDKDLRAHLANLRKEFVGLSELSYYHAQLIVMIRREVDAKKHFQLFEELWDREQAGLLGELNTRWLVSAADTFADYSDDLLMRSFALNVAGLVNSVKLCETERFINGTQSLPLRREDSPVDIGTTRVSLWDGTSAFAVGTDDTLRNYRWRLDNLTKDVGSHCHTAAILRQVFIRMQEFDNVYGRFRQCHTRDRTGWWS